MKIPLLTVGHEENRLEHPLARLHPATQLLGAVLVLAGVISIGSVHEFRRFLPLAGLLILGLVLIRCRPRDFLRGLKYLAFFFALVFFWPLISFEDKWLGLLNGALSAIKILLLYMVGFLLVRSASRWQVASVLERTLRPFARMSRVPLMLALTLGLLPVLATTATRLYASFAGRVPDRVSSGWGWFRNLPLLLSAYFARSLDRSERQSRALVARHFCGRLGPRKAGGRQTYSWADLTCLVLVLGGFGLSIGI